MIPQFAFLVAFSQLSLVIANVGTPLMWATALHMFLGNACIGLLEGGLLALIYRVHAARAVGLMILANYFSAWVGWMWLSGLLEDRTDLNLYNASQVLWIMVAAAYAVTLVLEWPFVVGALWGKTNPLCRSCLATLFVQTMSYSLLFGWYGLASVNSLLTQAEIVSLDQITLPPDVMVYYIANEDGDVYSRDLGTGHVTKVIDLQSTDLEDCLSFKKSPAFEGFQEIVALLNSESLGDEKSISIDIVVPNKDCPLDENKSPARIFRFQGPGHNQGLAAKLGTAANSPWTFEAGFWPAHGLSGENSQTGERVRLALETPFMRWRVRHPILLPSNRVLFQLGNRQVCILDPESRKVAVLCFGRGAVAVIGSSSARASEKQEVN